MVIIIRGYATQLKHYYKQLINNTHIAKHAVVTTLFIVKSELMLILQPNTCHLDLNHVKPNNTEHFAVKVTVHWL